MQVHRAAGAFSTSKVQTKGNINKRPVPPKLVISYDYVYTKEALKAYKSLEAYDYFVCGHVQDCFYHEINTNDKFCFIKSEVRIIDG